MHQGLLDSLFPVRNSLVHHGGKRSHPTTEGEKALRSENMRARAIGQFTELLVRVRHHVCTRRLTGNLRGCLRLHLYAVPLPRRGSLIPETDTVRYKPCLPQATWTCVKRHWWELGDSPPRGHLRRSEGDGQSCSHGGSCSSPPSVLGTLVPSVGWVTDASR